jgi:plasmid stability protein
MGQLLVRNLDDSVIMRLKAQAKRKGVSLEQFLRDLLSEEATPDKAGLLSKNAELLRASGYKMKRPPEDLIREDRDR